VTKKRKEKEETQRTTKQLLPYHPTGFVQQTSLSDISSPPPPHKRQLVVRLPASTQNAGEKQTKKGGNKPRSREKTEKCGTKCGFFLKNFCNMQVNCIFV
jgi:hypothetical protein